MSRWKCTVAYDGSAYAGWQTQRLDNSVQEQIEKALLRLTGKKTVAIAAGRTDAGVNARGQVFHFDSDREMTERKWQGAMNALLPDDIHYVCGDVFGHRILLHGTAGSAQETKAVVQEILSTVPLPWTD